MENLDRSHLQPDMQQAGQTVFPHEAVGFTYARSDAPILLNGMQVIFDQAAPVYPVQLEVKDEETVRDA